MNQERFWNESSLKQELQIILQDTRVILQDNIKYTHFVTKIQCLLYINNVQFIIETFLMFFRNLSCPSIL